MAISASGSFPVSLPTRPLPSPQPLGRRRSHGFLSLFQTKLILTGIADPRTLEAISLTLGEYDRGLVSHTIGRSHSEKLFPGPGTSNESVTYHTQRHRTLPPGEIAQLHSGRGLLLYGTRWGCCGAHPGIEPTCGAK
jgi:hypothetical protein